MKTLRHPAFYIAVTVFSLAGLLAGSYWLANRLYGQAREAALDNLAAVAALKANQLELWVGDKTSHLAELKSGDIATGLVRWQAAGGRPGAAAAALRYRLDQLRQVSPEYEAVWLFDLQGRALLSSSGAARHPDAAHYEARAHALHTRRPVLIDFHVDHDNTAGKAMLELLAPLFAGPDGRETPVGFLIYGIDPDHYFYPMLRQWPTASRSSETQLFRVEGSEIVYLGQPRYGRELPLAMRRPLDSPRLLAAQAARGGGPIIYGVDYRGMESVGVLRRVPAMGWYLLAKIDEAEIFAEARQGALNVAIAAGLLLAALLLVFWLVLRRMRGRAEWARLAEKLESLHLSSKLQVSEQRLKLALEAANEGLWDWDLPAGEFFLSPTYYTMLGYEPGEFPATFHGFTEHLHPDDLAPLMGRLAVMTAAGEDRFELEFRLRAGDGGWRWMFSRGMTIARDADGLPARIIGINLDITERRAQEAERRMLFDTIAASLNEIYLFDAGTIRFRFANRGALANLGYTLEQMRAMTPLDINPDYNERSFAAVLAPLASGEKSVVAFRTRHRRADGSFYPIDVHIQLYRHDEDAYYLAIVQDITERAAAEAALRESEIRFRTIFDSIHEAILILDIESGAILAVNRRACEMFGRSEAELLAASVKELSEGTPPYSQFEAVAWMMKAAVGEPQSFEWHARDKTGGLFWVEMTMRRAYLDEADRLLAVVRDITRRKAQDEELRQNLERLTQLNKRLEEAHGQLLQSEKLASIGQLAAGVAHELNNPIGFVHSNLGSLEKYLDDIFAIAAAYEQIKCPAGADCPGLEQARQLSRQKDFDFLKEDILQLLTESRDGLARVRQIVQDLRDFSRVGESARQWANLHKELDATLNIVWNELKYKCKVIKDYGEIPEVYCVPSQLNQVFMNLLVNAGHAIETQGEITIRTSRHGDEVWVEVSDTGKGIPQENLNRIFEPFFTTKPVGKGTGLGLSLSYGIVRKHHGRIEVESEVGRGTTFRVAVPIQAEPEATTENEHD